MSTEAVFMEQHHDLSLDDIMVLPVNSEAFQQFLHAETLQFLFLVLLDQHSVIVYTRGAYTFLPWELLF